LKFTVSTGMFLTDPQSLWTLVYRCRPAQDSSGNYLLPQGSSYHSSTVVYRQSVTMTIDQTVL